MPRGKCCRVQNARIEAQPTHERPCRQADQIHHESEKTKFSQDNDPKAIGTPMSFPQSWKIRLRPNRPQPNKRRSEARPHSCFSWTKRNSRESARSVSMAPDIATSSSSEPGLRCAGRGKAQQWRQGSSPPKPATVVSQSESKELSCLPFFMMTVTLAATEPAL
jgi:hypothetical protein